jgi:hypothetical protein
MLGPRVRLGLRLRLQIMSALGARQRPQPLSDPRTGSSPGISEYQGSLPLAFGVLPPWGCRVKPGNDS